MLATTTEPTPQTNKSKYPILQLGDVEELPQKLENCCSAYQRVHCHKPCPGKKISGRIQSEKSHVFDIVESAFRFKRQRKEWTESSAVQKKY